MNILITGGAGFIGSHLARHYVEQNHNVYVVDNLITGSKNNIASLQGDHFCFFQDDVCTFDFSSLPTIDIAYHLASPASPIQYKKHPVDTLLANSHGTYRVSEALKNGVIKRLLFASTSEIYGDPLEHPQSETYWGNVNTLGPRACYDESKRFGEAVISTYHKIHNCDTRIVRIFNTYGPQMEINDGRVVSNFITQALRGNPITLYGDGLQTRSFCYVTDLVEGLIRFGEMAGLAGVVINLGNPDEKTMKELAVKIKAMTRSHSEIIFEPIDADDPKKRKPDISKAKRLLNWLPHTDLEAGLTQTITYFERMLDIDL